MFVTFNSVPIANSTEFSLQIFSGECGDSIAPNGSIVLGCKSTGIVRHNGDGSSDLYLWASQHELQPPIFGNISDCNSEQLVLTLWRPSAPGSETVGAPEENLIAKREKKLAQPGTNGKVGAPDLSVIELEHDLPGFGDSYDALSFRFLGNTAIEGIDLLTYPGKKFEYTMKIADSEEKLTQIISFAVEASGTALGVQASGSASLLSKVDMKSTSVALVCKQAISLGAKELKKANLKLIPALDKLMEEAPRDFYKQFGTHFISRASRGGLLTLVLVRDYQSLGQKLDAAAKAEAEYDGVKGSAEFKLGLERFSSSGQARLELHQSGWIGLLPTMNSTEVLKYVEEFPDRVQTAAEDPSQTSAVTDKVALTPFSSIASPKASKAFQDTVGPSFKITADFVQVITHYQDLLNEIGYLDAVGLGVHQHLNQWAFELRHDLNELQIVWGQHRGELTLPSIESLYEKNVVRPPSYYEDLIEPIKEKSPVLSGASVYLRFMNGQQVAKHESTYLWRAATWEYCPTLKEVPAVNLRLKVVGGQEKEAIRSGNLLTIETQEVLPIGNQQHRFLSAFSDYWVYYYELKPEYGLKQQWRIEKPGGGPINYGDKIQLINVHKDEKLGAEAGFLNTMSKDTALHWVIDKV